jgi:hypothetical protein
VGMTQTIQPCSWVLLIEADKKLKNNKPETEDDNMSLVLQVYDGLNNLYEKLNRLNYLVERKNLEKNIHKGVVK